DISSGSQDVVPVAQLGKKESKVPMQPGEQRLIIATCEKGTVEDMSEMKDIKSGIEAIKAAHPNFVELASREAFRFRDLPSLADPAPARGLFGLAKAERDRAEKLTRRGELRVGIARLLNTYVYAPFFNAYLQSLGVKPENILYSDYTSGDMYRAGSSRGAIDPCFPAKIGIAHVHNLLAVKGARKKLDAVFFPMVDVLHTNLQHLTGSNACPTVTACPATVKAAFTKESDLFAEHGAAYLDPITNFRDPKLLAVQFYDAWAPLLGLTRGENERAIAAGFAALEQFEREMRRKARETLDQLEREDRIGIVMLGRAYHHDPGLNHEIPDEFQKLGYPIFSQSHLPQEEDILERLFGDEVRAGVIQHPLDISDVWKNSYSASTNQKVWAAKFTARHPNLVALEMSSFKCGHDAPIYGVIEGIIERSGTPYFSFKDLDENKPSGSIKIRVETIDYFLRRYRETVSDRRKARDQVDARLAEFEQRLRAEMAAAPAAECEAEAVAAV
ncbi:MAG: acyl-CoA dehydratase activase-related protein, partial [Terriglobales bacterium]